MALVKLVLFSHHGVMEHQRLVQISKTISKALRHKPESLGLKPTLSGWVEVNALLNALKQKGLGLSFAELEEVVTKNDKQRFSFDQSKQHIRANQGHSIAVDLGLTPLEPPKVLYHGTTQAALSSVLETGLQRMSRHHVHLSPDTQTALRVGSRHGKAVILQVAAGEMHQLGLAFFCSDNGVWLTDAVPPRFLQVLEQT
jgi:putative RNA 2'-phosphotransferase